MNESEPRKRNGFSSIDNEFFDGPAARLGPYAAMVYLFLNRRADANGYAFPSFQHIAEHTGISVRKVIGVLKVLVDEGCLRVETRTNDLGRQTSNGYFLLQFRGAPGAPLAAEECTQSTPPMHDVHPAYAPGAPSPMHDVHPNNTNKEQDPIEQDPLKEEPEPATPAVNPTLSISLQFRAFHDELQKPGNRTAILRDAFITCFGAANAPDFGRIGMFAKRVGGAGMALELFYSCLSRPPNGDILAYLEATYKRRNGTGSGAQMTKFDRTRDNFAIYEAMVAQEESR